jgi:hypothetical protein
MTRLGKNDRVLGSVRPCCGTEAEYRRRLRLLIDDLHASVTYWIRAAWRANEPELLDSIEEMPEGRLAFDAQVSQRPEGHPDDSAGLSGLRGGRQGQIRQARQSGGTTRPPSPPLEDSAAPPGLALDAIPAAALQAAIRRLTRRWQRNFNAAAEDLADWFGQSVGKRSDRVLASHLKKAGVTVKFRLSRAQRDVLRATIEQNVSLIRSIPQKYLHDVEGMVMRSVQTGRDLGQLTKSLERTYKTTRKRAAFIARDQSNKATSALNRSRLIELGISEAIWVHSHAGKVPRPTHLKMHGKKFDVAVGMWDPAEGEHVHPGELINCFPGSTDIQIADGVEKAYRHWYSGDLTELVTNTGKTVRVTPNHPILTPRGWVAAGLFDEGDDIVEIADEVFLSVKDNADQRVPTLEKIFDATLRAGTLRMEVARSVQFHGDGSGSHVDIVSAARALSFGIESLLSKGRFHLDLAESDNAAFSLSLATHLCRRSLGTASRFIRGLGKALTPLLTFPLHAQDVCFASTSQFSTSLLDAPLDDRSICIELFSESEETRSSLMLPTKHATISRIHRKVFSGHVFNLQTRGGWYVCNGIVAHNCRCTSRAVVPGFA